MFWHALRKADSAKEKPCAAQIYFVMSPWNKPGDSKNESGITIISDRDFSIKHEQ